jgi:hypothetical protein
MKNKFKNWFYHKGDNLFRVELISDTDDRLFVDLPLDKIIEAIGEINEE